jgi:uncharacterized protein YaiE (UPF0345 family)
MGAPMSNAEFSNVTASAKANIYFDGKVVSHTIQLQDGSKKTLGVIYPGEFHFSTGTPERMDIIAGECQVTLDGQPGVKRYTAGSGFDVPGKSGFTIRVESGIAEYICSFG